VIRRSFVVSLLAWSLAVGTWPAPARAVIPTAEKITEAVAAANRSAGRSEPVLLDVTLTIDEGPPAATGVLATHPTGLARLELRSHLGFVERHLLQGNAHSASRDGLMLDDPRHFLPPVFLLQATSGAALSAALASFGIAAEEAVLGRVGDFDCYVLGGRLPRSLEKEERRLPSMWVDLESYEVVRVDGSDGVRYRFGPSQDFDGIRVPRWVVIEAPDEPAARLDIVRAAPANAPAAAFGMDWLSVPRKP
jgi:hypothetical protein